MAVFELNGVLVLRLHVTPSRTHAWAHTGSPRNRTLWRTAAVATGLDLCGHAIPLWATTWPKTLSSGSVVNRTVVDYEIVAGGLPCPAPNASNGSAETDPTPRLSPPTKARSLHLQATPPRCYGLSMSFSAKLTPPSKHGSRPLLALALFLLRPQAQ